MVDVYLLIPLKIFLIPLKIFQVVDYTTGGFWSFGIWIMHRLTPWKYGAARNICISFYIKFKYYVLFTLQGSIMQHENVTQVVQ